MNRPSGNSRSWLDIPVDSDFTLANLPFGVFSIDFDGRDARCATILGDTVIDLSVLEEAGLFEDLPGLDQDTNVFAQSTLNAFLGHSKPVWLAVRERLISLFTFAEDTISSSPGEEGSDGRVRSNPNLQKAAFHFLKNGHVQLHLPIEIGDYTDFYSSREHATNVGTMFRGKDHALQPNWLHLPVGYHGRSSTIVVSGQAVKRPCGQLARDAHDHSKGSVYSPCQKLDFELEVAAVVGGPPNPLGEPINIQQAKDRLFGLLLMNDWSARDIQKWEYVPLGPFTSKNFATTISPWIVMFEALEPAPTSAVAQTDPVPLAYLRDPLYHSFEIALTVNLQNTTISQSNVRNLYWSIPQQLVHHTVTGCVLRPGDLLGSGTISGTDANSFGSLLELTWDGTKPILLDKNGSDGSNEPESRTFLEDGDTVCIRGVCQRKTDDGQVVRVGFGDCSGTILPAEPLIDFVDETSTRSKAEIEASLPSSSPETTTKTDDSGVCNRDRYRDFKLYSYWRSSSSWRVRVALVAKNIQYETVTIDLSQGGNRDVDYRTKNPMGQVPLLECTDAFTGRRIQLTQSLAILHFLDEAFPKRKTLIPHDPVNKAAALEMVEVINTGVQPLQNKYYLERLEKKSGGNLCACLLAKEANENGLVALEVLVQRHRKERPQDSWGPFALGTFSPSIVDAFFFPQVYNARRIGVDVDSIAPTMVDIEAACAAHAWFRATHPRSQPGAPRRSDTE